MPRSDKKDTTCACCGYKFTRPAKLRQHYQSKKNQCSPPPEISSQKEGQKKANIPRPRSPSPTPAPIVHTRGRDRQMEKPKAIPPTPEPELAPPSGQNQGDKYIDRHARKTGEHLRTWGSRLRLRWFVITGEECDLPKTLKECQRLHHDLLQADDEARENDQEDPEAGPGPSTQTYREGLAPIPQNEDQDIHFKECFVGRDLERPHQN
ncbi:hypothetical protein RhiirA1_483129 [Rhizophagus irregularis]|uniref:Uncharacterized protein n=1 Tax=Rhizophagus irregularis TaxID=588596 RepID=A0A2N0QKZ2_9GLOM|nr:hypothetical protein RhiirA1_483129 [Rhizophagus irregularis]